MTRCLLPLLLALAACACTARSQPLPVVVWWPPYKWQRPQPLPYVSVGRPEPLPPVSVGRPEPLPPVSVGRPEPLPPIGGWRPQPLPPVDAPLPQPLPRPRPPSAKLSGDYTVVVTKDNGYDLQQGSRFYLRDTQCLGYIPPSYLCGERESLGVEVRVSDPVAFPMIEVDASLRNVSIGRRPDAFGVCRDVAHVDTRLRCRGANSTTSRNARSLPSSP